MVLNILDTDSRKINFSKKIYEKNSQHKDFSLLEIEKSELANELGFENDGLDFKEITRFNDIRIKDFNIRLAPIPFIKELNISKIISNLLKNHFKSLEDKENIEEMINFGLNKSIDFFKKYFSLLIEFIVNAKEDNLDKAITKFFEKWLSMKESIKDFASTQGVTEIVFNAAFLSLRGDDRKLNIKELKK